MRFGERTLPGGIGRITLRQTLGQHDACLVLRMLSSQVRRIEPDRVLIEQEGRRHALVDDAVIVCAGGVLPTSLLAETGILVETKYGTV